MTLGWKLNIFDKLKLWYWDYFGIPANMQNVTMKKINTWRTMRALDYAYSKKEEITYEEFLDGLTRMEKIPSHYMVDHVRQYKTWCIKVRQLCHTRNTHQEIINKKGDI